MNHYFLESTKSRPHLIVLKQNLNCKVEQDFVNYLQTIEDEFSQVNLDEEWLKYWQAYGEGIVLEEWKIKYSEHMQADAIAEESEDRNSNETTKPTEEISVADTTEIEVNEDSPAYSWDDLWQIHAAEVYANCYNLYSVVYYNYFTDLKNSLLIHIEDSSCDQETNNEIDDNCVAVTEALANLGLPTAFGVQPQKSHKKKHKTKEHLRQLLLNELYWEDMDGSEENEIYEDEGDQIIAKDDDEGIAEDDEKIPTDDAKTIHATQNKAIAKKKKRNRKLRNIPDFLLEEKGMLKYWRMRFSLFSRFDEGIRLDRESWFSVTPEKVAIHLAERLRCDVILDAFCGCGGNTIQFARHCSKVIAIDIDGDKLAMAKHNAQLYGVADRIEFIHGDYLALSKSLHGRADIVFLSPPWGGPTYKKKDTYDIEKFLLPVGASALIETTRNISENIAMFLPRNSNVQQIVRLAGAGQQCEIEHNYLDTRLVAITALYGNGIIKGK